MKSSAKNINLSSTSMNSIFNIENEEQVTNIPLVKLVDFANHPFKVLEDEKMKETVESIEKHGLMTPIIVRELLDGRYEIISGHRRRKACEILGLTEISAIVRNLSDEESTIIMVDSNIQRETILISEKAFAYKLKLEALKSQGIRNDLTSGQAVQRFSAREKIAENTNDSGRQIQRYIRITELIPELIEMIDNRQLSFNVGVELSYLKNKEQSMVLEIMYELGKIPNVNQAIQIKQYSLEGTLTEMAVQIILKVSDVKVKQIVLKKEKLKEYFPKSYTNKDMEKVLFELLDEWKKTRKDEE